MGRTRVSENIEKILESFGPNAGFVWEILTRYLEDPASVDQSWREYFSRMMKGNGEPAGTERSSAKKTDSSPPLERQETPAAATAIRGVAAKIVENMEASLSLPTATSIRSVPAKVLEENRRLVNQYLASRRRGKISFTHVIAWAIVKSLARFPSLNAAFMRVEGQPFRDDKSVINIGIAIDVTRKDGTRTLLVPNIKNAGAMNFSEFVHSYNTIVRKAQTSSLSPDDFRETSVTLTNPGTVGTIASIPRLMPGQGAIIAIGSIDYPAEMRGMSPQTLASLAVSKVMTMTCTYDHRVIQGAESGQFLAEIHRFLFGEDRFYESVFIDLKIPYEPVAWSADENPPSSQGEGADKLEKHARALQLVNAYRVRGHLVAHLDPLFHEPLHHPELDASYYGLTLWDLDRDFSSGAIAGQRGRTLRDVLDTLRETYCSSIGVEYMYNQDPLQKQWLQERMEPTRNKAALRAAERKQIFRKLVESELFERFLHTRFVGHKRFSLEGGETVMPVLDSFMHLLADSGGERIVIGMAHRGRLNVLANSIGKPLSRIFSEFEGNVDPASIQGSGDVKYHLGASGEYTAPSGKRILVDVAPNPSHLESINPVVEGIVHAMQNRNKDFDRNRFIPILIHGDAAFAGQGIIAETLNLSQLDGYHTGGTIHLIINNQIGFTTSPESARSTPYCTDVAKMVQAPIFHVNGDDPEAAVRVASIAFDYRQRFNRDVVVDIFCYRRYGHNEGDEPSYTQPLLYKAIKEHPSVREIYEASLIEDQIMSEAEVSELKGEVQHHLERAYEASKKRELHFSPDIPLAVSAEELRSVQPSRETAISIQDLTLIVQKIGAVPEDFNLHPKLQKFLDSRRSFDPQKSTADWSLAEAISIGSLLLEGTPVRLTGQDTSRGTFSQRHAVLYDAVSGAPHVPLNHIRDGQARLSVYDSLLSEAAVLGFEFGYSVANPLTLVMWEAQFGDFANVAQVVIDQYISGSESKWQQPCDLVLLLPHGYEGQGPEHSSARLERFLQLCAEENMQVCNVSTPAQYFHVLRRQMRDNKRKPLVLMTPKSLLRHPSAVSRAREFTDSMFETMLDDPRAVDASSVKRIIFCSGKIFYDLMHAVGEEADSSFAVIRVEQFYPFDDARLAELLKQYSSARRLVWLQEEPKNMGAWTFIEPRLRDRLATGQELKYAGRLASASAATGSLKAHLESQGAIIKEALTI